MITKEQYRIYKKLTLEYEKEQLRLSSVSGSSTCPFCGGSKTTPFLGFGRSQNCTECDDNGKIKNRKLVEYELDDMFENYR